jgi:hypothetical protein
MQLTINLCNYCLEVEYIVIRIYINSILDRGFG